MQEPARKKRRWDVAAPPAPNGSNPSVTLPPPAAPPAAPAAVTADTLEKMKQQAAAIAAKLAGPGAGGSQPSGAGATPLPGQGSAAASAPVGYSHVDDFIDVVINYAPAEFRAKLTKRPTLTAIETRWHVAIAVKGRFISGNPPTAPLTTNTPETDRPLFLRINCRENDPRRRISALAEAESTISDILRGLPVGRPSPFFLDEQGHVCGKMYFGVLHAPPEFDAAGRLAGPGNSYLNHITATTGVTCQVQGSTAVGALGLQMPPSYALHITLTSDIASLEAWEQFKKAHTLAGSLIDTIRGDYVKAYPQLTRPPPPGFYGPPPPMVAIPLPVAMPTATHGVIPAYNAVPPPGQAAVAGLARSPIPLPPPPGPPPEVAAQGPKTRPRFGFSELNESERERSSVKDVAVVHPGSNPYDIYRRKEEKADSDDGSIESGEVS